MTKNFIYIVIIIVAVILVWNWVGTDSTTTGIQTPAEQKTVTTKTPVYGTTKSTTYVKPDPIKVQTQLQTQITNQAPAPAKVFQADQNITIVASDSGADVTNISVAKGVRVNLTITVSASGSGHGGLDFRSSIINTNTIAPGGTVNTGFIADKSFVITPYWPATNTATPYRINVTVQ